MKKWILFCVGLASSAGACYWIAARTNLADALVLLRNLGPTTLVVLSLGYALGFVFRAQRSVAMMKPSGYAVKPGPAVEAIILGYAANNLLPLRLGEVVRTLYASARTPCPRSTSLAWVAAERLADLLMLLLVLIGAMLALSLREGPLPGALRALLVPSLLLFLGLIVAFASAELIRRWLAAHPAALPAKAVRLILQLLDASAFLREPRALFRVALLSAGVWLCEGTLFVGTAWALHLPQPLLAGYLTLAIVNLSVLVPSSPGYVGVFHAAAVFALAPLAVSTDLALAMALICHGLPYVLVTTAGLIVFLRRPSMILGLRESSGSGNT